MSAVPNAIQAATMNSASPMRQLSCHPALDGSVLPAVCMQRDAVLPLLHVVLPRAFVMCDDMLGLVGKVLIDGLPRAWPALIGVLVKHDHPSRRHLAVEGLEGNLVGLVQIAVQVQERDRAFVAR